MNRDELIASAKRWMHAGLGAFTRGAGDFDFAVHHLGVATEHTLKAYLASLHPALLVEGKDFDSLLHATGHGSRATAASQIKTLGVVVAYGRCRKLLPKQLKLDEGKFASGLANARNGVAHLGQHDSDQAQNAISICFQVVDPLLAALDVDPADFWGRYEPLHDRMVAERADELEIALAIKITKAQTDFATRFGSLLEPERLMLLQAISLSSTAGYHEDSAEKTQCPACSQSGWLTGRLDVEWADDNEEIDAEDSTEPVLVLHPDEFFCPFCGLSLQTDELETAKLPLEIVTSKDPYPYMEPDVDLAYDIHHDR
ncbi:hypothetical protein [Streptomyces sp. NPDC058092]|uniref:hypothetical protein n=1 Tax=Streptomyces sp. NPDC058092 TaxID=3346336 RepID=UPI0036E05881